MSLKSLRAPQARKTFWFRAPNPHVFARWGEALRASLANSPLYRYGTALVPRIKRFWRYRLMGLEEVLGGADSGDLLIMRCVEKDAEFGLEDSEHAAAAEV